jgi:uncharacterized protein
MSKQVPGLTGVVVLDEIVAAGKPWGARIRQGQVLRITDLEGQQAVDFLCYDTADPSDRYCATNTIKVQGRIYIEQGTVLYSDTGRVDDRCRGYRRTPRHDLRLLQQP